MSKVSFPPEGASKLESYLEKTNYEMLLSARDYSRQAELLERIYRRGTNEFDYKRDMIYKENYIGVLDRYSNLNHYDEVIDKLKEIDEKDFFKIIKEIDKKGYNNFKDHYNNKMVQSEFNLFAEKLGVKIDRTIEPVAENIR